MLNVEGARFVKYERGLVSISEAFIFGEGATELFNFLLYIGFATEEELGYDKSIQRIKDDSGKTCFLYSISNTFYKTIDVPIYEAPPGSIPTEGCRVWNAQKTSWDGMVIDSTTYTLKDAWFDHRYPGEREMQRRILSKLSSTNASGKLLDHLLTIIAEESIRLSTLLEDITLMDLDRWSHPLQWSSDGDCLAPSAEKWENLHYSRRHWRSVYERCSEYPREVYDLKASLRAAGDIADALNLLRMAGFIHRNVSPKNLLMQLQTGHGLLSDLETAGEYLDLHLPSSKTTSGFTSIELIADIFLYPPPRSGFRPRPILHDHPYHDLESLYWVILFSVLSRIPAAAAAEPSGLGRDSQWRVFSKLFARTTQKSERAKLMTDPWRTVDILSQLDCDEDTKIALLPVLQGLLSTIVEAYQHLQKQPWKSCEGKDRWDPGLFSGLPYDAFKRELLTCIESLPTDLGSKPSTTSRT
ncbi:hypothetical protein BKA70DRAFT_1144186 [Coprinopsis sp. MPI-PUGE-AT-0042]|nr:hypothetical protein BKA70DRAFT_1144186 [Coprinopsis sp. MPI-PUGE-AT-0042]